MSETTVRCVTSAGLADASVSRLAFRRMPHAWCLSPDASRPTLDVAHAEYPVRSGI